MASSVPYTSVSTSLSPPVFTSFALPQLAYKADNELFIAAIHLHTSNCNCFLLWFSLWLCVPRQTAKQTQQRNHQAYYHCRWMGIYSVIFQWGGGWTSCFHLKPNNPTSSQWSSISMRTDVPPSVVALVKFRTALVRLKVCDSCVCLRGYFFKGIILLS